MLSSITIIIKLCVLIEFYSIIVGVGGRVSQSPEKLDELKDVEIYNAIVQSMNEWQKRQNVKKSINGRTKREDTTSVCYPELGCFESSGPFGYLDMLPSKPEEINTKFLLYPGHNKRRSGTPPAEVHFYDLKDAFEWAKNGFNRTIPTKVLIHGFGSDCSHIWIYEMRSALMAVEEVNIICVDWENGASLPNYVKATANTRLVGKQLAMLIRGLIKHNGLSPHNTHLIGFSLGAHVAGFAGAELGNLSRITGLDPAGPLFESQDPRARLDQNDAGFVDVIHSNGENLILGGLGSYQPMGHVDFYPNGGRMQKGCSNLFVGAVSDIIWSSAVEGRSLCNHRRAYKFFTDSVSPRCHFPAFPCESYEDFLTGKCFPCTDERGCGNMGYYADRSTGRGQLYLITRDEEPFCANQYNVKIETSPSQEPIISYGKIQITLIGDSALNETFMMTRKEDEEMKLGDSISRILVPHPILSEPSAIQILYTAYSGWLSSGLTQWRIDKVTLSDSFGKILSVCKRNLILESGLPITLPLYPGNCNGPNLNQAQDRVSNPFNSSSNPKSFVPTPVVRIGLEDFGKETDSKTNGLDSLNIPWRTSDDKENSVTDNEGAESSRAFNTRIINDQNKELPEIVEPIVRGHSNKNGRSHDLDKPKSEISEPILRSTSTTTTPTKNFGSFQVEPMVKKQFLTKINKNSKDISYNFYNVEKHSGGSDWVPSVDQRYKPRNEGKWKREDDSKVITSPITAQNSKPKNNNPLETIAMTVQFLPQRLAKMFEQAEKYARETILPLVSTYTPKFISDIILPKDKPRYIPLNFEEDLPDATTITVRTTTITTTTTTKAKIVEKDLASSNRSSKRIENRSFDLPVTTTPAIEVTTTTPYTHIQKIRRKGDGIGFTTLVPTEPSIIESKIDKTTPSSGLTTRLEGKEITRRTRDEVHARKNILEMKLKQLTTETIRKKEEFEPIYVDLPIFDKSFDKIKYIPLSKNSKETKNV